MAENPYISPFTYVAVPILAALIIYFYRDIIKELLQEPKQLIKVLIVLCIVWVVICGFIVAVLEYSKP